ncbi:MAG TPA: orotidine-5'-phosphate decarboxylase [Archaeoglobaceae archaeon]|nr:orotidine-5'-phosphate decarboxylase [Archaeoglobaceae archaeon]
MIKKNRLILALDVTERVGAKKLVKLLSDYLDAVKINYPLALSASAKIIGEIAEFNPVIADFKIADIPYTSSLIAEIAFKAGASGVIVHGFAGSDTVRAVVKVAEKYRGDVYLVSELSSEGGIEFLNPVSDKIVKMAEETGCTGIVAPATRPERIAHFRKISKKLTIISPGVGAQGGNLEDVFKAGADYVIVGRSVYGSQNPEVVVKEYVNRIEQILKTL